MVNNILSSKEKDTKLEKKGIDLILRDIFLHFSTLMIKIFEDDELLTKSLQIYFLDQEYEFEF